MKILIFDSGPLINLSMNGLLYVIEELKQKFNGKFIITDSVKYETLDRPVNIPRFQLGALRIKQLIDSGILELPNSLDINENELKEKTQKLMNVANNCIKSKHRSIKLISEAETSCLALSQILKEKNIENMIIIDERTTRILTEKPKNLEKLMSRRLHFNVSLTCSLEEFKGFRFIRSTELVYVAHKKGILKIKDQKALEAVLFATKFKGSSVSFDEINAIKKL